MLAATIVMAVATVTLALFTAATWKILATQHKLYDDPELRMYPWPAAEVATTSASLLTIALSATDREKRSNAAYVEYRVALVNPGSVPVALIDIQEQALNPSGGHERLEMWFAHIREPGPKLITDLPSLIPARDFAVCWRYVPLHDDREALKKMDFSIRVTCQYHNGRRVRTTSCEAEPRWGYDEAYPGQRAGASSA